MTPQLPLQFYAHRSGHESWQYCPRRRYLQYHHLGRGIGLPTPVYFDIGTAVHKGLEYILERSKTAPDVLAEQLALDGVDIALSYIRQATAYGPMRQDERFEIEALISGLLWTFWYRVWPSFITKFEVLMTEPPSVDTREFTVDRAVEYPANALQAPLTPSTGIIETVPAQLHLLSRPDWIARDRSTHEIVAGNWKTINSVTDERRQNIASSLQVNVEAHYAERLYSTWMDEEFVPDIPEGLRGRALMQYMDEASAYYKTLPREVAYTQIIYLVKGSRICVLADGTEIGTGTDYSESAMSHTNEEKFWRQDSFLCYRWVDLTAGKGKGLPKGMKADASWSYRYYNRGNKSYNQLTKDYARQGIWEADITSQQHVHQMNSGKLFPSTLNVDDDRNEINPLDRLILFENPIYRDADRQHRLLTSMLNDEMDIAQRLIRTREAVAASESLDDTLDYEFPMRLISCRSPVRCEFDGKICNAEQATREPLFTILPENSIWKERYPHHKKEMEIVPELVESETV